MSGISLPNVDLTSLLNLATYLFFFAFMFYGQRIQSFLTLGSIGRSLSRLDDMKLKARDDVVSFFQRTGGAATDAAARIDQFLDYVTIMPVDMDPNGIIRKIEHIAETSDERARAEIRDLMKGADSMTLSVAQNMLEMASGLNMIYKVVRHYYIIGKKTNSYMTLVQLQMSLPIIMEQASALAGALDSIRSGQPIGDGIGPLVASKFIAAETPKQMIAKDTILARTEFKGRSLYVLKAEGPMGYVGQPGVAIQRLVEEMLVPLDMMIMVDAAAKLEGEETGEIAQGIGAAIGGLGVEKYQIEEVASKHNIPVYAVLVKEGEKDVMATMRKEIADAAQEVRGLIERVIDETTKEGDVVLLAGIGNTLGIAQ